MGRTFLPIGDMKTDHFGYSDEGSWYIRNLFALGGSYQTVGEIESSNLSISDATTTQGVYVWRKGYNSTVTYHATNTNIYEVGVGSRRASLSTPTYGWFFAPFGPSLFATNGVDAIQVCTGTTFADITIPTVTGNTFANPKPKFLITFRNQLVGANITTSAPYGVLPAGTYPHLVWWSSRGDGEMWGTFDDAPDADGTNYVPIFDGSYEITGLAAGENCVFVFKEHSIFRLDGPDFAVSPVSLEVGCIAPRAIQRVGDEIYFISQEGLSSINSQSAAITHHTKDKVSSVLLFANSTTRQAMLPPDFEEEPADVSLAVDAKRVTMAADIENNIICVCYSDTGGYTDFTLMFYNTLTGQVTFSDMLATTALASNSVLAYTDSRRLTNAYPLGTISFAFKINSTAHYSGRLTGLGNGSEMPAYVRWPFMLHNPKNRVSIRSIKPVFADAFYGQGIGDTVYTVTGNVLSQSQSLVPWTEATSTPGTSIGNDFNVTFENCPMAELHSIGIVIFADAVSMQIFNFKGIEVEWEDGPDINA